MTEQEAIKMLDKLLLRGEEKEIRVDAEEMDLALHMGINAIEKQIPKKMKNLIKRSHGFHSLGKCPVCDINIVEAYSYCPMCGQRLDWEGGE